MRNVPKLRFKEFSGDWEEKKLGEIADIYDGTHQTPNYVESGIKFFGVENITNNNFNITKYVTEEEYLQNNKKRKIEKNDILMTRVGSVGEVRLIDWNVIADFSVNLSLIKLQKNNYPRYIVQVMQGKKFQKELDKKTLKVAFPQKINLGDIGECKINLPSLQEQEKIGNFLFNIDKKIFITEEKLDLFKEYKKGVMQKIFNQELRFKDNKGNNYPEWEEKKIEDIFKITRGYVLAKTETKDISIKDYIYPVFSSQTLNNGLMGFYNKYLFENCITWTTDGANAGTVKFRKGKFYCTNVCGVLISDIYNNNCIAEILSLEAPKHVSYVGNPKLMNNIMAKIKITIPTSLEEQEKIANFLSSIDEKIDNLTSELEDLKEFKKGLLQQMFV